ITAEAPFASALVGEGGVFVSEVDESDGSIALYNPRIAVLNNVSFDHKSLDELRGLFGAFAAKAKTAVLNLDNEETAALATKRSSAAAITYSLSRPAAQLFASGIKPAQEGVSFQVLDRGSGTLAHVDLKMPGRHNVANALAAIGAALACGVPLSEAAAALKN